MSLNMLPISKGKNYFPFSYFIPISYELHSALSYSPYSSIAFSYKTSCHSTNMVLLWIKIRYDKEPF